MTCLGPRALALAMMIITLQGPPVNAGMGPPTVAWKPLERRAYYLGTFEDLRGHVASFFVDASTHETIGPFERVPPSPSEPGATPQTGAHAGAELGGPGDRRPVGTLGTLRYLGAVPLRPPRGAPVLPSEGAFAAFTSDPHDPPLAPAAFVPLIGDALGLGLLAGDATFADLVRPRLDALLKDVDRYQAAMGMLLSRARAPLATFLAASPVTANSSAARAVAAIGLDGLPALAALDACPVKDGCHPLYVVAPIARAWLAHDLARARERVRTSGLGVRVDYLPHAPLETGPDDARVAFADVVFGHGAYWVDYAELIARADPAFHAFLVAEIDASLR